MKLTEVKNKILIFGNNIIDSYFPNNSAIEKLISNTCKYLLKNKIDELDSILNLFSVDDEINILDFVEYMKENMIGDGLQLNMSDYIKSDNPIKYILPNRTLIITKDDLDCLI